MSKSLRAKSSAPRSAQHRGGGFSYLQPPRRHRWALALRGWRNGRAKLPALVAPVSDPVVERLQAELDSSGEFALQQARVALLALDTHIVGVRAEIARLAQAVADDGPDDGAPVVSDAAALRRRALAAERRRAEARALDAARERLAVMEGERWATADAFRREALTLVGLSRALASVYWNANLRARKGDLPAELLLPAPEASPELLQLIEVLDGPNLGGVLESALGAAPGPALDNIRSARHTMPPAGIGEGRETEPA